MAQHDHDRDPDIGTNSTISLMTWLSTQFSTLHEMVGGLREGQMAMRHRMNQLEAIILGRGRLTWMDHLPWTRIMLILVCGLLLLTGHLTVPEIKGWIARALLGTG